MKKGTKVKWNDRTGTSLGKVHRYSVDWILVEWDDGTRTLTSKEVLDEIDEGG